MDSESLGSPTTVRFYPVQEATLEELAERYRVDKTELIRRMVAYADEHASDEELFAEEIAHDRARDRRREKEIEA